MTRQTADRNCRRESVGSEWGVENPDLFLLSLKDPDFVPV